MAGSRHRILLLFAFAALGGCSGIYFEQPLASGPSVSFATASTPVAQPHLPVLAVSSSPAGVSDSADLPTSAASAHLYLLRGLIGDIFSRGMDKLAYAMNRRGVPAEAAGVFAWRIVAEKALRRYRADGAPIVLIGHSTGGDNIIAIARRLNEANVPVALLVTFDPTPVADPLPSNVERALNVYQSTNPIGGGQIKPSPGFRGHLANVNLREHREIIHITMDKSDTLHALVAAKIFEVIEAAKAKRAVAALSPPPQLRTADLSAAQVPSSTVAEPAIPIKYIVPASAPIVIWDSGMAVTAADGDTMETVAQKYGVPVWAVAQINGLNRAGGIQPGQRLIVPRNAFAPGASAFADNNSTAGARQIASGNKRAVSGRPARLLSRVGANNR